ncbi:class I SAM-dependent methyltransferase [Priestia koreensis]|uniref:class I SAM-dependent methyltransferase n=2 Tax=Priestia koreensis TaxID=284581 RepID=UPI0028F6D26D|nr:class I SAM-dependent methyltransferase [Priestia koreensis]
MNTDRWNASLYDEKHSFVSRYGGDIVDLLDPQQGECILDLGCGTGDLAYQLYKKGANVIGVDKSENMVMEAKKKYPERSFLVGDVTELSYHEEFDAVFSNATLHWIKTPEKALQRIAQSLKPGGRFVAEFGGKGNVQTITNEIKHQCYLHHVTCTDEEFPWYYPSIGEHTTLMEGEGFHVTMACHIDRPTPLEGENGLRNWIEMFAGALLQHATTDEREEIISQAEQRLKTILYHDRRWVADYKRIRVRGIKVT